MVLCVPGLVSGVAGSAQRAAFAPLADQYLEGGQAAWEQAWTISNDSSAAFTWADGLVILAHLTLSPVGLVLFAVAIWRSQTLPQGAAILWLAYLLLFLAVPLTPWALPISDLMFTSPAAGSRGLSCGSHPPGSRRPSCSRGCVKERARGLRQPRAGPL